MIPPTLDPTQFTALHSLDFGNFLSMDGRAHPLDALQPAVLVEVPATVIPGDVQTGPSAPVAGQPVTSNASFPGIPQLPSLSDFIPKHFGARLAVGVIAVVIVLIVAARLIL